MVPTGIRGICKAENDTNDTVGPYKSNESMLLDHQTSLVKDAQVRSSDR